MSEKTEKVVDTKDKSIPTKEAVLAQAIRRFADVEAFERANRKEAVDDLQMLAGIGHWPKAIVDERKIDNRPILTINKLPSFTDQVISDSRLNEMSIKIKPYGGGATQPLADTLNGLIRNIENMSDAQVAYQTAQEGSVNNGFGYFRIITTHVEDTSFDQEIRIKRIRNPMTVYLDHAHTEHDARDGRFAFVTEMVSREEYKVRFPDHDLAPWDSNSTPLWFTEDQVRIAEYWVKEPKKKKLYLLTDKRTVDGDSWDAIVDDLRAERQRLVDEGQEMLPVPEIVRQRTIESHKVVHYLLDGAGIIEGPTEWPGKYIPIVPVWGKEIVIGEERLLRGLIRFAKDPQRMYNYFRTAATETVALTPKAPYIGTAEQFEDNREDWAQANRKNLPYLAYSHQQGVPPPQRQVVTQTAIGEITEANISNDEMKATTSLFDASLGAQGNETSGRAILARQREGDIANYVFADNLKRAIKYGGDILIDLIPRIYDTQRQVAIIKDDGEEEFVMINQSVIDANTGRTVILNDMTMGNYKVVVSSGPSFSTQREEAAQSMLDFVRVAPETASFVIDLIAENMDWPGATKIANRLKKLLPEGIDGDQPLPPKQPSPDDIFKQQKIEGTMLGNILKKLDIIEKKQDLTTPKPRKEGSSD